VSAVEALIRNSRIAYFTMEIALRPEIHTYSGGLGVLAGDTARSAADLEVPLVVVTLVSRGGYLRQEIDSQGSQVDHSDPWDPERWAVPLQAKVAVTIEGREVWVRPWLYVLEGATGAKVPVILLDTQLAENDPVDREITDRLYGGDESYRLKQEIVLGVGGLRALRAAGFDVSTYHMNEGHSAFLALELLRQTERKQEKVQARESIYYLPRVREQCVFTTHTPVEAGTDQFSYELVGRVFRDYFDIEELKALAGPDRLNMTRLALSLSGYINGVAKRHAEISTRLFPGYHVHAITNGVHAKTWTAPPIAKLFDRHIPGWLHEPELLVRADQIPDEELWSAHQEAKGLFLRKIETATGVRMEMDVPVIGSARRMTGYKRPDLLFRDLGRVRSIRRRYPFQVVLAGKAHPRDMSGKDLIRRIHGQIAELRGSVACAFLQNYDLDLGLAFVSGSDIWLNTPLPPMEASGTSGMKAAFNGLLNLSILDGWWLEGCVDNVTGWGIGSYCRPGDPACEGDSLYEKLESAVLPLYHDDRAAWIRMMKQAISKIAYYFNSHRMMRRYAAEAYLR